MDHKKTPGWQIVKMWAAGNRFSDSTFSQDDWQLIWTDLVDRIDHAIREYEQRGRDYRKHVQVMKDQSEHGPFWQQFYLRVLNMPGVIELFDLDGIEPQWNEAVRIRFKKPTLRAVDPNEVIEWMREQYGKRQQMPFVEDDLITRAREECRQIIRDLAQQASGESGVFISPMEMGAK